MYLYINYHILKSKLITIITFFGGNITTFRWIDTTFGSIPTSYHESTPPYITCNCRDFRNARRCNSYFTSNSFLPSVNGLRAEKFSKLSGSFLRIAPSRAQAEVSHQCWHFKVLQARLVSQEGHNLDESGGETGLLLGDLLSTMLPKRV